MGNPYDYDTCIRLMEKKGKELFGAHFQIAETDKPLIKRLLVYFLKDSDNARKQNIFLTKGILLAGPVGCGKTAIMTLLRLFQIPEERFILKTCRDISFEFYQDGFSVIQKYGRGNFGKDMLRSCCFDDLGTENNLKYYGNECNVMAEILLTRYDYYVSHRLITHLTTNLNSSEIETQYGLRVRSRMREMFNLISFPQESKDKRS